MLGFVVLIIYALFLMYGAFYAHSAFLEYCIPAGKPTQKRNDYKLRIEQYLLEHRSQILEDIGGDGWDFTYSFENE